MKHEILIKEMMKYYEHEPKRIQHFIKVHSLAKTIATLEKMNEKDLFILETAAITHDIGIKMGDLKHGSHSGSIQEIEGPPEAEKMLKNLSYDDEVIDRVCYLIGHHHTYKDIDSLDYQILVEADFLVNLYEDNSSSETIKNVEQKIFKTKTGKELIKLMF